MSAFPSTGYTASFLQPQYNLPNNTSGNQNSISFGARTDATESTASFGYGGGRGGFGRGRGSFGGRGGRGGFGRGGRGGGFGGFGRAPSEEPSMFSSSPQSIASIFGGSAGGTQPLPNGGYSFGVGGFGRPNETQPLISQNLSRGIGRFGYREEPTLLGLEQAVQRSRASNQRSLFDNNNATTTLSTASNFIGPGGLFNNRPPSYYSGFYQSSISSNTSSVFSNPRRFDQPRTLPARDLLSGRNSSFTLSEQALLSINRSLARPSNPQSEINPNAFGTGRPSNVPGPTTTGQTFSIQAPSSRLNPPLINSSTPQPHIFGNSLAGTNSQPQTQATNLPSGSLTDSKAPAQQNASEPIQPQNEYTSEEEEEEEEYDEEKEEEYEEEEDEEEPLENDPDATTFAEDLQNLMASHQMMAPEDLFANDTFTQNLVQFFRGYQIKVPRNKVLSHLPNEEPEAKINNQEKPVEKKEEPAQTVQNRGMFQEIKIKAGTERILQAKGKGFRKTKNKIKKQTYQFIPQ